MTKAPYVAVGGVHKAATPYIAVGGAWKTVVAAFHAVGGVWKQHYAPPEGGGGGAPLEAYLGGEGGLSVICFASGGTGDYTYVWSWDEEAGNLVGGQGTNFAEFEIYGFDPLAIACTVSDGVDEVVAPGVMGG